MTDTATEVHLFKKKWLPKAEDDHKCARCDHYKTQAPHPQQYSCKMCGNQYNPHEHYDGLRRYEKKLCFMCDFWYTLLEEDKHDQTRKGFIWEGVHYQSGSMQTGPNQFKGHGGRLFTMTWNDGKITKSNNVWCQGEVPRLWVDLFQMSYETVRGLWVVNLTTS